MKKSDTKKESEEKPQNWKAKRSLFEKRAAEKVIANRKRRQENWK